ncbi:MAG: ABC transporter permease [Polyangiaceae bacterium]
MLRFALRRLLWALPTLFGISLVVFGLTTLVPEPVTEMRAVALASGDFATAYALDERRRPRFLDLPRFFDARPTDVSDLAARYVTAIVRDGDDAAWSAYRLGKLGGAALPHVLPKLDQLGPTERGRVALALRPIAERMDVGGKDAFRDGLAAATFWNHFWQDRAFDFTAPAVKRALRRLLRHGTDVVEHDLAVVDTFGLEEVIGAMRDADAESLERLTRIASRATEVSRIATVGMRDDERARVVAHWEEWWYVHRIDYRTLTSVDRVVATVRQTRYGMWAARLPTGRLGVSTRDGEPIHAKLLRKAPITLGIATLSTLASFAIAVPLGVVFAIFRNRKIDLAGSALLFALYSLPAFWVAEILARTAVGPGHATGATLADFGVGYRLGLPVCAVMVGAVANLTRYQRAAVLDVLGLEYVRTARAKGAHGVRLFVVHVLRNALLPLVTLLGLQLPTVLGGTMVIEEVFGIPGLGYETIRAVEYRDDLWLIATILLSAAFATATLVLSDLAYAVLDPRVRENIGAKAAVTE